MMKNKLSLLLTLILLISSVLIQAGCGKTGNDTIENIGTYDSGYKAYGIGKNASGLSIKDHQFKAQTTDELIAECRELLVGGGETGLSGAIPDGIVLKECIYNEELKTVSVFLTGDPESLTSSEEILMKAAIVDTFTQFDSVVSYVRLYMNNEPMKDRHGVSAALMRSDFVESTMADIKNINIDKFIIYFASTDNTMLVAEEYNIHYYNTVSKERVVIDAIISGPLEGTLNRVLPSDTRVNNVYTEDGICYVDLDSSFLAKSEEQGFALKVYAIVNSLCELDYVEGVKILINGETSSYISEGVLLSGILRKNENMILKTGDNPPVLETEDQSETAAPESAYADE